jgi:hypothetical protein
MSFVQDDIMQSLDYRFGKAGSFRACDLCKSINHAIDVGCSVRDDFAQQDFGVADFDRHNINVGGPHHESAAAWNNTSMHESGATADDGMHNFGGQLQQAQHRLW